jgi:hypothetical protein
MPIALVRSISLPNLKIYTTISLLLVSGCFYYAFDVVRTDPHWKIHQNTSQNYAPVLKQSSNDAVSVLTNSELLSSLASSLESTNSKPTVDVVVEEEKVATTAASSQQSSSVFEGSNSNETSSFLDQMKDVIQYMTHEPFCIWVSLFCFFYFNI